jgi:hypothetical protein
MFTFWVQSTLVATISGGTALGKIPNEYIVVFDPAPEHRLSVQAHLAALNATDGAVQSQYHIEGASLNATTDFLGYHLIAQDAGSALRYVRSRVGQEVRFVEQNAAVEETLVPAANQCTTQTQATWGIARTCERNLTKEKNYVYNTGGQGEGVIAYIIDSGECAHAPSP